MGTRLDQQEEVNLCDDCLFCFSRTITKQIKDQQLELQQFFCKKIGGNSELVQATGLINIVTQCSDYKVNKKHATTRRD